MGKISAKAGEKLATSISKTPGRTLEFTSNIASAGATKNPEAALSSLPEMNNFYHTGKGVYLEKLVGFYAIYMEQITDRLNPSAPLENTEFEQRLDKN